MAVAVAPFPWMLSRHPSSFAPDQISCRFLCLLVPSVDALATMAAASVLGLDYSSSKVTGNALYSYFFSVYVTTYLI